MLHIIENKTVTFVTRQKWNTIENPQHGLMLTELLRGVAEGECIYVQRTVTVTVF
jgi:hypothetical protein